MLIASLREVIRNQSTQLEELQSNLRAVQNDKQAEVCLSYDRRQNTRLIMLQRVHDAAHGGGVAAHRGGSAGRQLISEERGVHGGGLLLRLARGSSA